MTGAPPQMVMHLSTCIVPAANLAATQPEQVVAIHTVWCVHLSRCITPAADLADVHPGQALRTVLGLSAAKMLHVYKAEGSTWQSILCAPHRKLSKRLDQLCWSGCFSDVRGVGHHCKAGHTETGGELRGQGMLCVWERLVQGISRLEQQLGSCRLMWTTIRW